MEFLKQFAEVLIYIAKGFMGSAFLRNIVAFFIDVVCFFLIIYTGFYGWQGAYHKSAGYWWSFIGLFIGSMVLRMIAKRLWVTRVCPNCCENRAIRKIEERTGNVINGSIEKSGDNNYYRKIKEEYRITRKCIYGCGYMEESLEWRDNRERISM